jgi:hypothetical protein
VVEGVAEDRGGDEEGRPGSGDGDRVGEGEEEPEGESLSADSSEEEEDEDGNEYEVRMHGAHVSEHAWRPHDFKALCAACFTVHFGFG